MALPDNINTQAELRQLFEHYVANNAVLSLFEMGEPRELAEKLKTLKAGQVLLFCPYPSMIPRDRSGALDFRYTCQLGVFTPKTKNDASVDSSMDTVGTIIRKLLIRIRKDNQDQAWSFTINDVNQIDPIIEGPYVGYQYPLYLGDYEPSYPDATDWDDLT